MVPRVAVVTDSVSDDFYFPLFLSYYRKEIPGADIFVITPAGRAGIFANFDLAGVVELGIDFYDDTVRAQAISEFVSQLTKRYTHILRVDCDEFAIADPRRFPSLQAYIQSMRRDYVTAMGYDVVAAPSDPLDLTRPILGVQRRYAFALNALNKTCLTRKPLTWGRGFHACQNRPVFDGLFLMHLKRADIDMQFRFGHFIAELTREDEYIRNYYLTPRDHIVAFHKGLFQQDKLTGWDKFVDQDFQKAFFSGLKKSPNSGLWDIEFKIADHLVEIPAEFNGRIGPVSRAPRTSEQTEQALAAAAGALLAIERRIADATSDLDIATPAENRTRRFESLLPDGISVPEIDGLFGPEQYDLPFLDSYKFVHSAMGALAAQLERTKREAAFREQSLRRRLQQAEKALSNASEIPLYRAETTDRIWFSVDRMDAQCVAGWAIFVTEPDRRLRIDLMAAGVMIATTTADRFQPHLRQFGYDDGCFGFRFELGEDTDIVRTDLQVVARWDDGELELGRLPPSVAPANR